MADSVKWGRGGKEDFVQWARYELERVRGERSRLEARWRDWLTLYRAPRKEAPASIPFEGASNRIYPATAMALDPIWANLMQTVHAPQNLWTVSPLNERWIDAAKPLQDYLQWLDLNVLKMWDTDQRVFLDMLKLGTGIYKVSWRFEQTRVT